MTMIKERTMDEWLFALAIYPSFNALERYLLFLEMIEQYSKQTQTTSLMKTFKNNTIEIKRLSQKKKASFACFLAELNIRQEQEKYRKQGVKWTAIYEDTYPRLLREIYAPPVILFYQGDMEVLVDHICLAVVGARVATDYGLEAVEKMIPTLLKDTKQPIAIVSGLAKGIDTKAHEVTLEAKGHTIGVIGAGLDQFYPRKNKDLQQRMAKEQLVLSEYPLGAKPQKFRFPERNRIIAGLSRGIFVVEAKKRSGSLITAYNGLDENRDIFALPGSIFEKNNEGCHRLIQLGAKLTRESTDILEEWSLI